MRREGTLASIAVLILLCAGALPPAARAAAPVTWEYPSASAPALQLPPFSSGEEVDGVAVGATGALTLSLPFREIFPAETEVTAPPLVWSASLDAGGRLFLGTGNTGRVLRIDRKGTSVSAYDSDDLGVHAVASGLTGSVYIGTFPDGSIYKLGSEGRFEPWFDPDERYVWSMAVDSADRLYVATGERGIIYRVMNKDDGAIFFDSDESHITTLVLGHGGTLLAGTDPGGLLYRIDPDGRSRIILDTGLREVSSVAVAPDGTIYAAAISEQIVRSRRKEEDKSELKIEVTPVSDGTPLEEQAELPRKITIDLAELLPPAPGAVEGAAGRLYRISPDGEPTLVWKSDSERIFSVTHNPKQGVLFGTGGLAGGRIYRLESDQQVTLLRQMVEPQVSALATAGDGRTYACTSNPGRVYVLEPGSLSSGRFVSPVFDGGRQSRWGTIRWDSELPPGTRVEIFTRSGSRLSPDATWSDWSPSYPSASGSPVGSPPGRYIQWKAELSRLKTEETPVLRRVALTALPRNIAPVVSGLKVLPLGEGATGPEPAPVSDAGTKDGKKLEPPKGARWIVWSSSDPDGDEMVHSIRIRRAGESDFRQVADGLGNPPFAFDDSGLEEGIYEARLDASDAPANGPARALSASTASPYFVVDHVPPVLTADESRSEAPPDRLVIDISAKDARSRISRGEYTFDDEGPDRKWKALPCQDGICDTAEERFVLDVQRPVGSGTVQIRVVDEAGNVSTVGVGFARRDGG